MWPQVPSTVFLPKMWLKFLLFLWLASLTSSRRHRHRHGESLISEELGLPPVALPWPVKREALVEGDLVLGGLMMVHERDDTYVCGPVMPQGGIQALETMLFTLDVINNSTLLPHIKVGAHILDDCDKDTYGLEMAVDFIKGEFVFPVFYLLFRRIRIHRENNPNLRMASTLLYTDRNK